MITTRQNMRGFSLVELMIALGIGSIIATAMMFVFIRTLESNREQFKSAQQLESGRFALDAMFNDIRHAGYYGEFTALPPASAALPDPCAVPAEGDVITSTVNSPFAFFIQGYAATAWNLTAAVPAACSAWMDATTVRPGSDIIVVRRLNTTPLVTRSAAQIAAAPTESRYDPAAADATGAATPSTASDVSAVASEVYVQVDADKMNVQYGVATNINMSQSAKGVASTVMRKHPYSAVVPKPLVAAYIRKVQVHIYFVANCRVGTGLQGQCAAGHDGIPTLKRLELSGGSFTIVPIAEGIEFIRFRYGIDNAPATRDGAEDSVAATPATVAEWQDVVTVEINLLARNTESTATFTDDKSYDLGSATYTPAGTEANFKRHSYRSKVFVTNIGARRQT